MANAALFADLCATRGKNPHFPGRNVLREALHPQPAGQD